MRAPLFAPSTPLGEPNVHVLLVGVSLYPGLPNAPGYDPERTAKRTFGLGQLTSPSLSASALADWFLTKHDNPDTPLGSVELLLSPAEYTPSADAAARLNVMPGTTMEVLPATFDEIKAAAGRWYSRLHSHRENIGVFYFCGHGLESSDRYLLAADFNCDATNLDQGIINFEQTFQNMRTCLAWTQLYLLDACRDNPEQVRRAASRGTVGRPIVDPKSGPEPRRNALVYHAAAPDNQAFGPPGGKSYFAGALVDCLNGLAARACGNQDYYSIDHATLALALQEHVDRLAERHGLDLQCRTDGSDVQIPDLPLLHRVPSPVDVMTRIVCRPRKAHRTARLTVQRTQGPTIWRATYDDSPWRLTLQSGLYTVSATFVDGAGFADDSIVVDIVPTPTCSVSVAVQDAPRAQGDSGGLTQ